VVGIEAGIFIVAATYIGVLYYYQVPYVGPPPLRVVQAASDPDSFKRPQQDTLLAMSSLSILGMSLISLVTSLSEFGAEKIQFERERLKGARVLPYLLGKDIARFKLIVMYSVLFILPFYAIVGSLLRTPSFPALFLVVLLNVWTVNGIAYFCSVIAPTEYSQV
jgi:hypothetical protein